MKLKGKQKRYQNHHGKHMMTVKEISLLMKTIGKKQLKKQIMQMNY